MSVISYIFETFTECLTKLILIIICLIILTNSLIYLLRKLFFESSIKSDGKAVLITGCDHGFGNRLAHKLNTLGFKVFATCLNSDSSGAKELAENCFDSNKMIILQMDVTDDNQVNQVFNKVIEDLKNSDQVLWAVVNNAGILLPGPFDWGTMDFYTKQLDINVLGTVRVTRTFMPLIKASKGRITNVASILGRISLQYIGGYCMSKHSVIAFTDSLRREVNKWGISVASVEPTMFKTRLLEETHLNRLMTEIWKQTSNDVKNNYNFEKEKKFFFAYINSLPYELDIDLVVNDITDSLTNSWPKTYYRPMGALNTVLSAMFIYLPAKLTDNLFILTDKMLIRN